MELAPEVQQRIEATVRQVLEESDMSETTEYKVRREASERLKMNLSQPKYKPFVRQVVEAFLEEQKAKEDQQAEEDPEEEDAGRGKRSDGGKEYTDDGDLIICKLSEKRKVTIQEFRGKTLVSIREYYKQGSKELPTSKGSNRVPGTCGIIQVSGRFRFQDSTG
ncbi:hypothetical protein CDL15_Pgr022362 [Punica granatum]|uniref:DEK-C domain-containing protein n=1 Tax=Punica granatum TaxID=22663 RepID=A0A218Y2V7_PUNGR|nr:hypothetical protein CDL15_Pgr022362 [Punica granatum]